MPAKKSVRRPAVDWQDWSPTIFARSKREKKPVLLSIGAVWCHWCHTMDRGTYSDPSIIKLINRHCIPVRVDTDRRPDINERYNLGGWPTTAALAPDGSILLGGTYIPPEQFPRFISAAVERFRAWQPLPAEREPVLPPLEPSTEAVERTLASVRNAFDPAQGGFGAFPKFPHQDILDFLVSLAGAQPNADVAEMLTKTLDGMAAGEIHDKVGGGFYRYATQQDWSIPHFEKMLDDNARLLRVYLDAYALSGNKRYAAVAEDIIFFITSLLLDKERFAFYGSQDADEEYCRLAYAEREKRGPPHIDKTLYADWNAWAVRAFLRAGAILDDSYTTLALRCLDVLLAHHVTKDGVSHVWDGRARGPFLLRDHAALLGACVDAWNATLAPKYLAAAERIAALMARLFEDKAGGFYDIPAAKGSAGRLAFRRKELVVNGIAALGLHRLSTATGTDAHRARADRALAAVGAMARGYGMYAAAYALASEAALKGCLEVKLDGKDIAALHEAALRSVDPRLVVLRGKKTGPAMARICKDRACLAPVTSAKALEAAVR